MSQLKIFAICGRRGEICISIFIYMIILLYTYINVRSKGEIRVFSRDCYIIIFLVFLLFLYSYIIIIIILSKLIML